MGSPPEEKLGMGRRGMLSEAQRIKHDVGGWPLCRLSKTTLVLINTGKSVFSVACVLHRDAEGPALSL